MIYSNFQNLKGMNSQLSPFMQPDDSPVTINGVDHTEEYGTMTKDLGYFRVGDQLEATKSITGLYNFRQTGAEKILATVNNAAGTNLVLSYNNAGTWTDIALTNAWDTFEDSKVEMEAFLNYCFFVGYDSTDGVWLPVGSLTGTTFSTATNVTDMPQAKYIKRYRDRLYIANCYTGATAYPFRVYYSSVPTAGALTWTPATDFLDVDYSEQLTGLGANWDRLVAFTEKSAYLYDQSTWKRTWETGCSAHRTIQNSGPFMFWVNHDGIWLSTGGQPQNIGGPVRKFIKAGNPRNYFSTVVDEKYYTYIGNVTVDGQSYTNCVIIYDIPTESFQIREEYNTFTVFANYMDSTGIPRLYMGASTGDIWQKSKYFDTTVYNADAVVAGVSTGYAIHADIEFSPIKMENINKEYNVKSLIAYAEKAQGANLSMRSLDKNLRALTPYKKVGQLTKYVNRFDINVDKGPLLQLRLSEYSKLPAFKFYGYTLEGTPYSKILNKR